MKLSEFRFDLPQNLIALNPTENREDARSYPLRTLSVLDGDNVDVCEEEDIPDTVKDTFVYPSSKSAINCSVAERAQNLQVTYISFDLFTPSLDLGGSKKREKTKCF